MRHKVREVIMYEDCYFPHYKGFPWRLVHIQEAASKSIEERRLSGHHIAVHDGEGGNWAGMAEGQ